LDNQVIDTNYLDKTIQKDVSYVVVSNHKV